MSSEGRLSRTSPSDGNDHDRTVGLGVSNTLRSTISTTIQAGSEAGIWIAFSGKAGTVGIRVVNFEFYFFLFSFASYSKRNMQQCTMARQKEPGREESFPRIRISLSTSLLFLFSTAWRRRPRRHTSFTWERDGLPTRSPRFNFTFQTVFCLGLVFFSSG